MDYLVSYRSEHDKSDSVIYGYVIVEDPVEWLISVQRHDWTYFILCVLDLSEGQFDRCYDAIKGM